MSWRSEAALQMLALDPARADEASGLIADELALAQAMDLPRAIGIALRARAASGEGAALEDLEAAIEMFRRAAAQLELARTLVELGSHLRRERRGVEAREPLREGLDLANDCGATALAERAADELGATGETRRSLDETGLAALTPSELRTARMAASGRSNREIAEDLFVTPRTIEAHLTSTYRKLGIRSRRQLSEALAGSGT
jgi:DNA-binding CsgD family transcriptional regulator